MRDITFKNNFTKSLLAAGFFVFFGHGVNVSYASEEKLLNCLSSFALREDFYKTINSGVISLITANYEGKTFESKKNVVAARFYQISADKVYAIFDNGKKCVFLVPTYYGRPSAIQKVYGGANEIFYYLGHVNDKKQFFLTHEDITAHAFIEEPHRASSARWPSPRADKNNLVAATQCFTGRSEVMRATDLSFAFLNKDLSSDITVHNLKYLKKNKAAVREPYRLSPIPCAEARPDLGETCENGIAVAPKSSAEKENDFENLFFVWLQANEVLNRCSGVDGGPGWANYILRIQRSIKEISTEVSRDKIGRQVT